MEAKDNRMLDINELLQLQENLNNKKIKDIYNTDTFTFIEFQNGEIIKLNKINSNLQSMLLNELEQIEQCSFCHEVGTKDNPLFNINKDTPYICKNCITLAVKTFLENNIAFDILLDIKNKKNINI